MATQEQWDRSKHFTTLANGDALAFVAHGDRQRRPLILIHGLSDSSRSFSLISPFLDGFYRVIPDLPSHGLSEAGTRPHTIEGYAASIVEFIRAQHLQRPTLVGHSLGAMVACHAAAELGEEISGVICMNGAAQLHWGAENSLAAAIMAMPEPIDPISDFFDVWHATHVPIGDQFLQFVRTEAARVPKSTWVSLINSISRVNISEVAERISVPALVLYGLHDHLFDFEQQNILAKLLRTEKPMTVLDCGHNPHWDAPEQAAKIVSAFSAGRES